MMSPLVLENDALKLEFDSQGRIVSLVSKITGKSFLTVPGLEDNWKLLVLTGGHPVHYIAGREQTPVSTNATNDRITFSYRDLVNKGITYNIGVDFTAYLAGDEARFELKVTNNHTHRVREAWYPILGGFEGFEEDGKSQIVHFAKSYTLEHDILHQGLPGAEYLFVVDGETAHYIYPGNQMQWIDLFTANEGLYISSDDKSITTTIFRLEKNPSEAGASGGTLIEPSIFPPGTPRWLKMMVGKLTAIDSGETWQGLPSVFWPHRGDWHVAAKHYRAWANSWMKWPERPQWLRDYVGWHHIVGKTYLGEIYHTFDQYTEIMKEAQERCGVDTLMIYGHTNIGCEGSDVDISPAVDLGGPEGFKRMCDELHAQAMKVMVFTHRQSAINVELPEYQHFKSWAITDRFGNARPEVWWKTTVESLMGHMQHYEATGPMWARICPYCDEWWVGFHDEIIKLMELGLDGIQLDTIGAEAAICYSSHHGHKPGTRQFEKLRDRLAWLREEIRAINPEFLLCGEEYADWLYQYLDLPYSRHRGETGNQVFRYTFPEMKENCAVSNYGYHQVNKSMMLGMGMDIEIEGLKKSILTCPELMDYMKQIVTIRRAFPDYLMNGIFIDTLKASVSGNVRYSVFEGPDGLAAVIWNAESTPQECSIKFEDAQFAQGTLCQPFAEQKTIALPSSFTLPAQTAAAIIATRS
jgi:hypothetical protein